MRSTSRLRPAVVTTAALALGLVLGGTVLHEPIAQAAAQINGSRLVDRSVAGTKLKRDTLTGVQVDESRLGTVPDAARLGGKGPGAFLPASRMLTFSLAMAGQEAPAQIEHLAKVGPLTFSGHCQISGSTVYSSIDVKPTHDGVIANGEVVPMGSLFVLTNDGTAANQTKTIDVAIIDPTTGLALDGQLTSVIHTSGASCRLLGHLVRDAG